MPCFPVFFCLLEMKRINVLLDQELISYRYSFVVVVLLLLLLLRTGATSSKKPNARPF